MNKQEEQNELALKILMKNLPMATLRNNLLLMAVAATSPEIFVMIRRF